MATNTQLAQMSSAVYQPAGAPDGWTRLSISSPQNDVGYYASAFRNDSTGEIVIANRGTEPFHSAAGSIDWQANMAMAANKLPSQYQFAKDFVRQLELANVGVPVTITGHSLGGSLAQLSAVETNLAAVTC